ncbi:hypothetical protein A7E78_10880 [Syntrophotalea acetylenivorans]|uniref:DUF116 domain-containing protein n=1 Tax=Syntrophotalea acetylenivorans TaxID=1842532 RepID=A0A1L3GQV1_9BACT|nr:DUF116 domain-containing protein [Syntrophotalea acetylenivorans]APG28307.1 hypothetical protein A7E78_10880 [Syntrophotalea acetylenivorans]
MSEWTLEGRSCRPPWLFLCVLGIIGLLLVLVSWLAWWVPSVGFGNIHPALSRWFGILLGSIVLVVLLALGQLGLTLFSGRDLFFSVHLRGLAIRYLLPAVIFVGRCFGADRDALQRSFITVNNQLIRGRKLQVPASQAVILLPHCVQLHDCAVKVTGDIEKCLRCGKCDIGDLAELAQSRGVTIAVATGGTLARKILMETRPRFVLAVACERDLTAGIRDAYPLPVYGVFNRRPQGPCYNTEIDLAEVEAALDAHVLSDSVDH